MKNVIQSVQARKMNARMQKQSMDESGTQIMPADQLSASAIDYQSVNG